MPTAPSSWTTATWCTKHPPRSCARTKPPWSAMWAWQSIEREGAPDMTTLSSELDIPVLDIDPYASANLIDPYPMHERMREAGPVVRLSPYPSVVACARHDEVRAVLNDHATFISGAGVGLTNFNRETPFRPRSLILEADPPLHTQTRTVLSRILSPKTVMQ